MIDKQRAFGIIGVLLVFVGMFLPVATVSVTSGGVTFYDSLNWWDFGAGYALLMIILLVASIAVLFSQYKDFVRLVGLFTAITIVVRLILTIRDAAQLRELDGIFAQVPMLDPGWLDSSLRGAQNSFIRLTVDPLGWVVMLIGTWVIIYSGFVRKKQVGSAYSRQP